MSRPAESMESFSDWVSRFRERPRYAPWSSPLEKLPTELLIKILEFAMQRSDIKFRPMWDSLESPDPKNQSARTSLLPSLQTSRRLYTTSISLLYRNPSTRHFSRLLATLASCPVRGSLIRTLDITDPRAPTLPQEVFTNCLSHTPNIRSLSFMLEDLSSAELLRTVLFGMHSMEKVAISGRAKSIERFNIPQLIAEVFASGDLGNSDIRDLSFNVLNIPSSEILAPILSRLPRLRALDVSGTDIAAETLRSIPESARLQTLCVRDCYEIDLLKFSDFMRDHPCVEKLQVLDLSRHVLNHSSEVPASQDEAITDILKTLPATLRALNLSGQRMHAKSKSKSESKSKSNLPALQRLCAQLEQLAIGNGLALHEVESLVLPPHVYSYEAFPAPVEEPEMDGEKHLGHVSYDNLLNPMRKAIDVCRLRRRLNSVRPSSRGKGPRLVEESTLRVLYISALDEAELCRLKESVLLGEESGLERIGVWCEGRAGLMRNGYMGLERCAGSVGWKMNKTGSGLEKKA